MINSDQIKQALEQKADSGYPTYTPIQIADKTIDEDSFLGQKIRKAMDLGVTKEQAINYFGYGTAHGKQEEKQKGFFERVGEDIKKRGLGLAEQVERLGEDGLSYKDIPRLSLDVLGQTTGGVFDIMGEGVVSGLRGLSNITPDAIEDKIVGSIAEAGQKIINTELGQKGLEAIEKGVDKWQEFKEENPTIAYDIESLGNVVAALPVEKAAMIAAKPALKVAKEGTKLAAKGVAKTAKAVGGTVKGATRFATRQVTGLSDDTIEYIVKHTDFDPGLSIDALRGDVGKTFTSVLDDFQKVESGLLPEYGAIRGAKGKGVFAESKNPLVTTLKEKGFDVDVKTTKAGVKHAITKTAKSRVPLTKSELGRLEDLLDLGASKNVIDYDEFLNIRGELSKLSKFDATGDVTKDLRSLAREMRASWNNSRTQIPGLEKLDLQFSDLERTIDDFAGGFAKYDDLGNLTLTDSGYRKLLNLTNRGKERELARIKNYIPDIEDKINLLRAVEDIKLTEGQKVATYARTLFSVGGGAALGGPIGAVVGLIVSSPAVLVPMLKAYGNVTGATKKVISSIIGKIKLGKKLSSSEAKVFIDTVEHFIELEKTTI